MGKFESLYEAIDPEDVFKPASQEELGDRGALEGDHEVTRLTVGSTDYVMRTDPQDGSFSFEADGEELVSGLFGGAGATRVTGDTIALFNALSEIMYELGDTNMEV